MRQIVWTKKASAGYAYWKQADRKVINRIDRLITAIQEDPFSGIGKPEALRGNLTGAWSRRITGEHRLVYLVEAGDITILQCRYHY